MAVASGAGGGGGGGGGVYPAGRGTPAVAAKAGSPVRSAEVAPGMEATDTPLAARQRVSALTTSSTAGGAPGGDAGSTARTTYKAPAWQADTAAPGGVGRVPPSPPTAMVMAVADRVRVAPEEPGTERVSPVGWGGKERGRGGEGERRGGRARARGSLTAPPPRLR